MDYLFLALFSNFIRKILTILKTAHIWYNVLVHIKVQIFKQINFFDKITWKNSLLWRKKIVIANEPAVLEFALLTFLTDT